VFLPVLSFATHLPGTTRYSTSFFLRTPLYIRSFLTHGKFIFRYNLTKLSSDNSAKIFRLQYHGDMCIKMVTRSDFVSLQYNHFNTYKVSDNSTKIFRLQYHGDMCIKIVTRFDFVSLQYNHFNTYKVSDNSAKIFRLQYHGDMCIKMVTRFDFVSLQYNHFNTQD
jgi:hypothetical protein